MTDLLSFALEAPITASFDPDTGVLAIESTIHRNREDRRLLRLRLDFPPDVVHGLLRLLAAAEREYGITVGDAGRAPVSQ